MDIDALMPKDVTERLFAGYCGDPARLAEDATRVLAGAHVLFEIIGNIKHLRHDTSWLGRFFASETIGEVAWTIVPDAAPDARVNRHTQRGAQDGGIDRVYRVRISVGAILRIASLCNEVAATAIDKKPASPTSSLLPPAILAVTPDSQAGKHYADALTMLTLMLLFGHESTHVLEGHTDYDIAHPGAPDTDIRQLEQEADGGAGMFLMSRLLGLAALREFLGYVPDEACPDDMVKQWIVRDTILAATILAVYLHHVGGEGSERYEHPTIRLGRFIAGMKSYLNAENLPYPDELRIEPHWMKKERQVDNLELGLALLSGTSARSEVARLHSSDASSKLAIGHSALAVKPIERSTLAALRPLGLRAFIAKYLDGRTSRK